MKFVVLRPVDSYLKSFHLIEIQSTLVCIFTEEV